MAISLVPVVLPISAVARKQVPAKGNLHQETWGKAVAEGGSGIVDPIKTPKP